MLTLNIKINQIGIEKRYKEIWDLINCVKELGDVSLRKFEFLKSKK